jgi:catechol 2,3-dioxygenase-like lactoylglutathione lyase family enzyme
MITGIAHVSFSVTSLDRTIDFYGRLLDLRLEGRTAVRGDDLGKALFGSRLDATETGADLDVAIMKIGGLSIEFIEYKAPKAKPYHGNPSIAGSAHVAFRVDDIEKMRKNLMDAGVEFHSEINNITQNNVIKWRWCYFRDPDGIVLELVEKGKTPDKK